MSLKNLFLIFSKNDYEQELKRKLSSLENNIEELKKTLVTLQQKQPDENQIIKTDPPIIIEKIHIEKIILDKYELNNNFGQLGIKELKGKLNIGATYGSEFTPKLEEEEDKGDTTQKEKKHHTLTANGPKVNINPKREEE